MYREVRVDLGMYAGESAAEVVRGLQLASELFVRTFGVLNAEQLSRTMTYAGQVRTLAWIGAQAVHEVEHHLADVRTQLG
jgi:hypothetical protein